jgi:glutathione peroxidase
MLASCPIACQNNAPPVKLSSTGEASRAGSSFYDLIENDIHGQAVSFEQFKSKVVFIVNVASYCGYTESNYELFRTLAPYIPWGLDILIFPCNQFGAQEPGDAESIANFAHDNHKFEGFVMSKGRW